MRKPWAIALITLLVLAAIVTAGIIGFRIGLKRGAYAADEGTLMWPVGMPHCMGMDHMSMDDDGAAMQFHNQHGGMFHKNPQSQFYGSRTTATYRSVPPILRFFRVVFTAVALWLLYKFISKSFTGQGWQLTLKKSPEKLISPVEKSDED